MLCNGFLLVVFCDFGIWIFQDLVARFMYSFYAIFVTLSVLA